MKNTIKFLAALLFCGIFNLHAQVKLQEGSQVIKTYIQSPPNAMPRFYEGRNHQGVQRRIYPYPFDDGLTTKTEDVKYPMIALENEYILLKIAPEQGGRIYGAYDKTNGYEWIYENRVVKPSLIGMVGNWRSGSIAWGYPHHHGPHTVQNMDYEIEEHADGSKTVWINHTEQLMRVNVLVGYTIYPHSSIVEMAIHPRNRTAFENSFLFWANPAVYCDSAYQVIFPPSVQYVTHHGKRDMTAWPIADSRYGNYNFTGMDISWWKNTHVASSFFSWDPREDYFGGYDHKQEAGTAWVGNHYTMPGMKYWADGNNAGGYKTNEGLTDDHRRYIEMMAGFYTDNQPDYSWLEPYESKSGKMVWFPMRELGGLKYANRNGAMNYEINGANIEVRLNTTSPHQAAKFVLKGKGNAIKTELINISPAEPRKISVKLPAGVDETDLDIALYDAKGELLLGYIPQEHVYPKQDKPEALGSFPKPEDIQTVEELYLTGLRINQFHSILDPMPYYQEALRRDAGNSEVNNQLGILAMRDNNWEQAEKYFRTAAARVKANYTRPKNCESLYYLGIVLRELGRTDEAYDWLYQASWGNAFHTAAYYQLAEIDCTRGDYETALDHVNRSLTTNMDNICALNLKGFILRQSGATAEAQAWNEKVMEKTKINYMAMNELIAMNNDKAKAASDLQKLTKWMRDDIQAYLEFSTEYMSVGAYKEAMEVLKRMEAKGNTYSMLYYYIGYLYEIQGDKNNALAYYKKADTMPSDYCFPFRSEEAMILNHAMAVNPSGAKAPYYLGNLYYEHQPRKAIELWEKSAQLDPNFHIVLRNLGLAYKEIDKDYGKALASMQQAAKVNSSDARLLFELDELNELNKVSPKDKYEFLLTNYTTATQRGETLLRLITRAVEYGKYDEALKMLDSNSISETEGSRDIQNAYLNSYTLRALAEVDRKEYDAAMEDIDAALAYPIGLYGRGRYAQLYYLAGLVYESRGDQSKARASYQKAMQVETERGDDREFDYYKGLALIKMNKAAEAKMLFQSMLGDASDNSGYTQFEGRRTNVAQQVTRHYMAGLGYMGLGNKEKAAAEFEQALELNMGHIWSQTHLNALGGFVQEKSIKIVEKAGKFHLMIDGIDTYIKGIGGTNRPDIAAANGANAFRTWGGSVESAQRDLARAKELNMYVMQGIGLPKDSAQYTNKAFKEKTRASVKALAEALKDEQSLLVWGIGNEIEHGTANTPEAWKFVNELARLIKSIDSRHLVSTVISHNAKALNLIAENAPDLDVVGINSYGAITQLDKMVTDSKWKGAYIIAEWGPTGWWETTKTAWGAPIEQTSEEKRIVYEERYNKYIKNPPRCLGSFVFLWGQKEERTPTWFSMFVENNVGGLPLKGEKTPMVEAMERVWTGAEPTQIAPVIHGISINNVKPTDNIYVKAGATFEAKVNATDREGNTMSYVWEILKEATKTATGGAYEPRPDRAGQVQTTKVNTLKTAISEPGNYRLYVYVLDGTGFVSTANTPFQVQ
jgi:tetratricopeptide (TPR) repeat protein